MKRRFDPGRRAKKDNKNRAKKAAVRSVPMELRAWDQQILHGLAGGNAFGKPAGC